MAVSDAEEVRRQSDVDGEVVPTDPQSDGSPKSKKLKTDATSTIAEFGEIINQGTKVTSVSDLDDVCAKQDRSVCYYLNSGDLVKSCIDNECILGIDEAGRGPVLGPMVYGIAFIPKKYENDLKTLGCDDSKALTEEKREKIFDQMGQLADKIGFEAKVIAPNYISNCMLRRVKTSLNEISHDAAIELVKRALARGANITEIFVDTVGPAEKYQDKLQAIFPRQIVTVRSKADSLYAVVSAASIVAKVTRDVTIRTWDLSKIGDSKASDWGSGYPNDPATKTFLKSTCDPIFGFSDIVRFSWSTAEKVLEENAITVDWEEDESDPKGGKGTRKINKFFSSGTVDLTAKEQHRFFKERQLSSVIDF
ncbi:unnamed protein product [Nesidiocoris tenuis]|uniref:Ribonuclease n=1 Tax=Nesidiocoris tenuis TaxID=355587 RepID=A0A6H5GJ63_9HEMI|nr:unnamed protein product [Nesidiocoris tenuis]